MAGRLLVAYSNASNFVSTTAEYLESLARCSDFEVRYAHVTSGAELDFDLNEFDAVFHSYCARLTVDGYLSPSYLEKMKSFRGVKLVAAQDEYEQTNKVKAAIQQIGFHVMFTNAAGDMIERLYPRKDFSNTEFVTVLTGYVPEYLETRGRNARPLRDRHIHIGYRCRKLPAYYGRLGHEKFEIGRRMREICVARGIPHDIEWDNDKRLYGDAWYEFIGACRANLGSETGCNAFDFDGQLKETYERLSAARGEPVPFEEFCQYTDPIETEFDIAQIAPRIFEAAAMRTPLILFSGRYLDVIAPDEHYIELKKDFSNVDAVLARLDDLDALERMADRAYDRLVGSREFSYGRFARLVSDTIVRKAGELGVRLRPPSGHFGGEGFDPMAEVDLRERPTPAPRHSAICYYRRMVRQSQVYSDEVERLRGVITSQSEAYTAEVERLNTVLAAQKEAHAAESARLRTVHKAEIGRLDAIIAELRNQCFGVASGERRWRNLPVIGMYRLRSNPTVRRLGRLLLRDLPQSVASRIRWCWHGLPVTAVQRLLSNPTVRRLGRGLLTYLPESVVRRIKLRLLLLFARN